MLRQPRYAQLAAASVLSLLAACRGFAVVAVVDHAADAAVLPLEDAGPPPTAQPPADAAPAPTAQRKLLNDCGDKNPAGLSAAQIKTLMDAPSIETSQRFLYPYAGTVFPGGMSAPLVMWDGPSADAVLLRLRSNTFEYTGCLKPSAPGQLAIPQAAWDEAAADSAGADNALELQLSTLAGERASGPISRSLVIARGNFASAIYYMSYSPFGTSAIWRLRPRETAAPLFSAVDCSGCHTLAANGGALLGYVRGSGSAYRLTASTLIDPEPIASQLLGGENAALSPDGAVYVTTAHPLGVGPTSKAPAQTDAALFEVATGRALPNANIPSGAVVPAFSPSGALLAFNDFALDGSHGLAIMDFDLQARAARNYRELYRDPMFYPGWPSFLPGEHRLVFARGVTTDFSAMGARLPGHSERGPQSDLHTVDSAGQKSSALWRAMGFMRAGDADADTYLPFGAADLHQSYYPNVASVESGGYAWVFFDAIRNYGNQGVARQIWGAALDLTGNAEDPSHPAFYVPGQNLSTVNLRPFAVNEPAP